MESRLLRSAIIFSLLCITAAGCGDNSTDPGGRDENYANNALLFDGIDDYVWADPNLSGAAEGTVELWFKPDAFTASTALWVGGDGHPGTQWDIGGRMGSHGSMGEQLIFGLYVSGWQWAGSGIMPVTGEWYHLAGTWGPKGIKIYVNGTLMGTNDYSGANMSYKVELMAVSSWAGYFNGTIDEVRFWNIARDSLQIQATMADTLGPAYYAYPDSGLTAYYRFDMFENLGIDDDGADDDVRDLSVHGNHGDTRGGPLLVSTMVISGK